MKGFLGKCEAGDIWFMVQALVESSLMDNTKLMGCSTDIEKAFESIPRTPLKHLALHLGLPPSVIGAWFRLLDAQVRRFSLNGIVGAPAGSNCGLPEGCGMSVLGMSLLDFCWDRYQLVFAPAAVPLSYVDNYALLSTSLMSLLRGHASLGAFADMWSLTLDQKKTYMWSVDAASRAVLKQMGFQVKLIASELGGAVSYARRSSAVVQLERIASLDSSWQALRRLNLPVRLKEQIIRQAFWPKGLHAIVITPLHFRHIATLRTRAMTALGYRKAGAHPGLRLSLLTSAPETDPGFFQLVRSFMDFLRLIKKAPSLLDIWRDWARGCARPSSGPFAKIQELCAQLAWTVSDPPRLEDHDGVMFDLLTISEEALRFLLWEGWLQVLARDVSHRKDFAGLNGLHWLPSLQKSRTVLQHAQLAALREGAFFTRQHTSKFDLFSGDRCEHCGMLDSLSHRATVCPAFRSTRSKYPEVLRRWDDAPVALRERLLPARNPFLGEVKHGLETMPDLGWTFVLQPFSTRRHDLFTDGSAFTPANCCLGLAAWSVVSATHGQVLQAGPMVGFWQTANRAEVYSLIVAVRWCLCHNTSATVWSDSAYASSGLHALLLHADFDRSSNGDLWSELAGLVTQLQEDQVRVQHVPGHACQGLPQDLPSWLGYWNQMADTAARDANQNRSADFWRLWGRYVAFAEDQAKILRQFEDFHLDLAQQEAQEIPELRAEEGEDEELQLSYDRIALTDFMAWTDQLPLQWQLRWQMSPKATVFGCEFMYSLFEFLAAEEACGTSAFAISWLELAALAFSLDWPHPMPGQSALGPIWADRSMVPIGGVVPLSVAARVRYLVAAFRGFVLEFELPVVFLQKIDCSYLGIGMPLSGVGLILSLDSLQRIKDVLGRFTSGRPIRRSGDLSRPF